MDTVFPNLTFGPSNLTLDSGHPIFVDQDVSSSLEVLQRISQLEIKVKLIGEWIQRQFGFGIDQLLLGINGLSRSDQNGAKGTFNGFDSDSCFSMGNEPHPEKHYINGQKENENNNYFVPTTPATTFCVSGNGVPPPPTTNSHPTNNNTNRMATAINTPTTPISGKIKTVVTFGNRTPNNSSSGGTHHEDNNNKKRKLSDMNSDSTNSSSHQQEQSQNNLNTQKIHLQNGGNNEVFPSPPNSNEQSPRHQQEVPVNDQISASDIPIKMEVVVAEETVVETSMEFDTNHSNPAPVPSNSSELDNGQTGEEEEEEGQEQELEVPGEGERDDLDQMPLVQGGQEFSPESGEMQDEGEEEEEEDHDIQDHRRRNSVVKVVTTADGRCVQIIHDNDPDIDIKYEPLSQFYGPENGDKNKKNTADAILGDHHDENDDDERATEQEHEQQQQHNNQPEEEEEEQEEEHPLAAYYDDVADLDQEEEPEHVTPDFHDDSSHQVEEEETLRQQQQQKQQQAQRRQQEETHQTEYVSQVFETEEDLEDEEEAPELDLEEPQLLQAQMRERARAAAAAEPARPVQPPQRDQPGPSSSSGQRGTRRKAALPRIPRGNIVIRRQTINVPMTDYEKLVRAQMRTNPAFKTFFDFLWILQMRHYQSKLVPYQILIKRVDVRAWFEYIPNRADPASSTFRCRVCFKHNDDDKTTRKSTLENGQLKDTLMENRNCINYHINQKSHCKIIEKLKAENHPDYQLFELDPALKKELLDTLKSAKGPATRLRGDR